MVVAVVVLGLVGWGETAKVFRLKLDMMVLYWLRNGGKYSWRSFGAQVVFAVCSDIWFELGAENMEGNIGVMCLLTVRMLVIVCVADLYTIL